MNLKISKTQKIFWVRTVCLLLIAATALTFSAGLLTENSAAPEAEETLSKNGSRGEEVRKIQTKLKQWGYYKGNVDGVFGPKTEEAVRYFQRKNGLAVDGIAGPKTLSAMGISGGSGGGSSGGTSSGSDYYLLARIISAEARGETYVGQVAVGAVVLNRVQHPSFPNSVSGVVYQAGAFTAVRDSNFNQPISDSAYRAATEAMNGWDPSGGALYYYNPAKTNDRWIRTREVITTIGRHVFAK